MKLIYSFQSLSERRLNHLLLFSKCHIYHTVATLLSTHHLSPTQVKRIFGRSLVRTEMTGEDGRNQCQCERMETKKHLHVWKSVLLRQRAKQLQELHTQMSTRVTKVVVCDTKSYKCTFKCTHPKLCSCESTYVSPPPHTVPLASNYSCWQRKAAIHSQWEQGKQWTHRADDCCK